jgi:hypothetical protein
MTRLMKTLYFGIFLTLFLTLFWGISLAGEEEETMEATTVQEAGLPDDSSMEGSEQMEPDTVTVNGSVNNEFQLVTANGQTYEIAETETGDVLVQYPGQEVQVEGTITEVDGVFIMTVTSFTFIEK